MAPTPDTNLARFAAYAGFRHDLLAGDGYQIENASADFDGRVAAIRIVEYGRFGNVFYQTLHAVVLARLLGCRTVFAWPWTMSPEAVVPMAGLRFVLRADRETDARAEPTLAGHFFDTRAFESSLRILAPETAWQIIRDDLMPIFGRFLETVSPVGSRTLVMSFRAGDIFNDAPPHPFYVQPPASYYLLALAFARRELGVTDVRLVFEDDGNPAIACVRAQLEAQRIPYAVQSASIADDLACLIGASHLVAPFSTFAEVAAMLSRDIKTYFGFRIFESHQHVFLRQAPMLLGVLRQKSVRPVLIEDAAGLFTPPLSWQRSAAQLKLIADYPIENLRIVPDAEACAHEDAPLAAEARRLLREAEQEAGRLRPLLLAERAHRRAEADAASQREQALRNEREAAARDHLAASHRHEAETQALLLQAQERLDDLDRAFRASTSWRVTAPLRWLATALRGAAPARNG